MKIEPLVVLSFVGPGHINRDRVAHLSPSFLAQFSTVVDKKLDAAQAHVTLKSAQRVAGGHDVYSARESSVIAGLSR